MQTRSSDRSIITWLIIIAIMVFAMVFIGGVTRLTDSGLSMVDWRPLMGAIPPVNESQWEQVFDQYKQFPEYQKVNFQMSLSEFKKIFFWEYFHRLIGRMVGIVFFFPFLYFVIRKKISRKLAWKTSIAFILGGMQGLLGWYMVKSGLVSRPDVSHFRLAAHLSLAFVIIAYIYWLILSLQYPLREKFSELKHHKPLVIFYFLLWVQIIYGAFVAGLDAGLTHNTFPKMGRHWIPNDMDLLSPLWSNLVENPVTLQFIHRWLGASVLLLGLYIVFKNYASKEKLLRHTVYAFGLTLLVQFSLGALTIVHYVPLSLASLHQVCACILLLVSTRAIYFALSHSKNLTV